MVAKPAGIGTSGVKYGGGILALGLLAAAAIAYRARKLAAGDGLARSGTQSRPSRSAAEEVRHLHQLERAGETEWTPWVAITGLILFFRTIGLLVFGIVEGASYLLVSAP